MFLDEAASWSIINKAEAWEAKNCCGDGESDQDGFVVVKQEDIVEGIACFMAAYLLSLKETKVLFNCYVYLCTFKLVLYNSTILKLLKFNLHCT